MTELETTWAIDNMASVFDGFYSLKNWLWLEHHAWSPAIRRIVDRLMPVMSELAEVDQVETQPPAGDGPLHNAGRAQHLEHFREQG